jgi:predicted permease
MDSFLFSLQATMPVFLVMVVGWCLMRMHFFNESFTSVANQYVFKVALPVNLFYDIATTDLHQDFQLNFVLYCMIGTTIMFLSIWALSNLFLKEKSLVGAFAQASVRSSAAILGIAFVTNIYGDAGLTPLMIVAAVPLFNIYSVIILTFSSPEGRNTHGWRKIRTACLRVFQNPIILGILAGLPFSLLDIHIPVIAAKTITSIGSTATPIALLVVGAGFEGRKALAKLKPTIWATAIKLWILPAIGLPIAVSMGFTGAELIAILIMLGSPTTVSCYVMARNMNNDAVLSSSIVVAATLLSSVSLTFWIFLLRILALI